MNKDGTIRHWAIKYELLERIGGCRCVSCGCDKIWLLQFHHKDPSTKEYTISAQTKYSIMLKEVYKCVAVCANCHTELHYPNGISEAPGPKTEALNILGKYKCSKCGYDRCMAALDFHHKDGSTKYKNINKMINRWASVKKISNKVKEELLKCDVLCKNCHTEEHVDVKFIIDNINKITAKRSNLVEINGKIDEGPIASLLKDGKTITEIVVISGLSKSTVGTISRRLGYGKAASELSANKEKILLLHSQGMTVLQIHAETKHSKDVIKKIIKGVGLETNKLIDPRASQRKFELTREKAEELLKTMNYREIGELYGVTWAAARKRILKLKLKSNGSRFEKHKTDNSENN